MFIDAPIHYKQKVRGFLVFAVMLLLNSCVSKISKNNSSGFLGNTNANGQNESMTTKSFGEEIWRFKTDGKIFSSPTLANGKIFIGSQDSSVYCVNQKSGKQKWKFETGGAVPSTPAVKNGRVYFLSFDGKLYAVNEKTGKEFWHFKTGGEKVIGRVGMWGQKPDDMYMEDLYDFFLSSPIVHQVEGKQHLFFGSSDSCFYSLDASSGQLLWKFKTKGMIHSRPTIEGNTVFVAGWDTYLYALDIKTGKEKWKFKTLDQPNVHLMEGIQAAPLIKDGVVFIGARDAWFYAVDANTGKLLWKLVNDNSWILTTAAVKDNTVFYGTSDSYFLMALDTKTGKEKFRVKTNGYIYSSPVISGNVLYFGDFTGQMLAVDLESNRKKWNTFYTDGRKSKAKIILNKEGNLDFMHLAGKQDPALYSTSKLVLDSLYQLGPILSTPVVSGNTIYFGSADGYLYSVKLR